MTIQHAGLDKIDNAIRAHLRVNAQIALVAQALEHGLGDAADAGLNCCAIGYQ